MAVHFMKHRNFSLKVGGEIGLSLPTRWTKETGFLLTNRFFISVGYFRSTIDVRFAQHEQSFAICEEKHAELTISSGGE